MNSSISSRFIGTDGKALKVGQVVNDGFVRESRDDAAFVTRYHSHLDESLDPEAEGPDDADGDDVRVECEAYYEEGDWRVFAMEQA